MSEAEEFRELIRRVQAGDAQASADLVRCYAPAVRLAVHVRLTSPGLRRVLDSQDICQSVLASFFVRAVSGQYRLETPEQLVKLLTIMARRKLVNEAVKHRAACRDHRRLVGLPGDREFVDTRSDPSMIAAYRELLAEFRRRLSPAEQRLAEDRSIGRSWQEIAADVGEPANTLRMRLDRALDRVTRELGLES
jgi:DNA-directed RNA polymerase specialized sigma24 family protein